MRFRNHLPSTLFFVFLLACLLTGLAGTAGLPARAAPQAQATLPPTLKVIINELAWGGTIAAPSSDEWIELYNPGAVAVDLNQWHLLSTGNTPDINITLTGIINAGGYYLLERQNDSVISTIIADQVYFGPGNLLNDGGETLYLSDSTGALIDVVNGNGGPWPAGVPNGYGSMERYGVYPDSDYIWTTNANPDPALSTDFRNNPIYGTPKNQNRAATITPATITTIVSDSPDPSVTNGPTSDGSVNVAVTVFGGPNIATGTVSISGADTNCTVTLTNGTGNCNVIFTTVGSKTLTATFGGDPGHLGSSDTETHDVVLPIATITTITKITPTPATVNGPVNVAVAVAPTSGSVKPGGTVSITGADTNCTVTLTNGAGNCNVTFNTNGPKTLTATYNRLGAFLTSTAKENVDVFYTSTTTITADSPDPSVVNRSVSVNVTVSGQGQTKPTGTVDITGANGNCSITLANGTGTCNVFFSLYGTKTLKATYSGDNIYSASTDTEFHTVSYVYNTPTGSFVQPPPSPLLAINEFLPRPGHDWNNDGVVNNGDEYIEILNHGTINVNLGGYKLDDEANIGSLPYSLPSMTLKPGERMVFYGSQTGLLLSDGGDGVRLLKPNGQLMDAYNYFVVEKPDQSYCRLPDNGGADDWNTNCYPTPGLRNSQSGSLLGPPTQKDEEQPLCPIADTLPQDFVLAECSAFGNNIWNRYYWDKFGWYGEKPLPNVDVKWEMFAD